MLFWKSICKKRDNYNALGWLLSLTQVNIVILIKLQINCTTLYAFFLLFFWVFRPVSEAHEAHHKLVNAKIYSRESLQNLLTQYFRGYMDFKGLFQSNYLWYSVVKCIDFTNKHAQLTQRQHRQILMWKVVSEAIWIKIYNCWLYC